MLLLVQPQVLKRGRKGNLFLPNKPIPYIQGENTNSILTTERQ